MRDPKFESVTVESGKSSPVLECHVEPRLKISARSSRDSSVISLRQRCLALGVVPPLVGGVRYMRNSIKLSEVIRFFRDKDPNEVLIEARHL